MADETDRRPQKGEKGEAVMFLDGAKGYARQVYRFPESKLLVVHERAQLGAEWTQAWYDTSEEDEYQQLQDDVANLSEKRPDER